MRTQRHTLRYLSTMAAVVCAMGMAGCATKKPIAAWQEGLSRYIDEEGHGDPNVLRELTDIRSRRCLRPSQIVFGQLDVGGGGVLSLTGSRDVYGVLVGVRQAGAYVWHFFLVGVINRQPGADAPIEDLRLVAVALDDSGFRWRESVEDVGALQRYRSRLLRDMADADMIRRPGAVFPWLTDVYTLAIADGWATVTEERSGAMWRLRLDDGARAEDENSAGQGT